MIHAAARERMESVPLLSGLYQFGYVTCDLDAALRRLTLTHGIDRFRIKRDVRGRPGLPKMRMHQAHVFLGALQFELIQPAGGDDALYRDLCSEDTNAIRLHHLGMWLDHEAEFARVSAALREQHIPVVFESFIPELGGKIYADARASLGHYLEYVHMSSDAKSRYYAEVPQY